MFFYKNKERILSSIKKEPNKSTLFKFLKISFRQAQCDTFQQAYRNTFR